MKAGKLKQFILEEIEKILNEGANLDYDRYAFVIEKEFRNGRCLTLFDVSVLEELMIVAYKEKMEMTSIIGKCIRGMIAIEKVDRDKGNCYRDPESSPYNIGASAAVDKLGPMIYDFALQMVNFEGGVGLMADRVSVSKSASSIWQRYLDSERGATGIKVKNARLDYEPPNNTTKTKTDDCTIIGVGKERSEKDLELGVNHIFYVDSVLSEFKSMGHRGQQIVKECKKGKIINIDGRNVKFPPFDLEKEIYSRVYDFSDEHYEDPNFVPK